MPNIIVPRPMSGFPELLPAEQIVFNRCLDIVRRTFELFGFAPIETPAVERKEILTSKGGNEKEIYALSRLAAAPGEDASTDYALHFDLTVPLARYVAQHKDKLVFPFRRYQIQKVWRGERPQAGRYRELYQCDIDVIGRGKLSLLADAEMPLVIYHAFTQMNIGPFVVRVSNRRVLQGLLESFALTPERITAALHAIDDLEKTGAEAVRAALVQKAGLPEAQADQVLTFIAESERLPTDALLQHLRAQPGNETFRQGVEELETVVRHMRALGMPDTAFKVDLSIVRGLDYYTGTVYETRLLEHPNLGSICSGGRYDDLAGYFTTEKLPGVGISIGLSRLVLRLLEAGVLKPGAATPTQVLVTTLDPQQLREYLTMAAELRAQGIPTEVYLEPARIGDQLRYASRKGIRYAVIAGETEFADGTVKVKDLSVGEEEVLFREELAERLVERLLP